jgi:hypothetical protein
MWKEYFSQIVTSTYLHRYQIQCSYTVAVELFQFSSYEYMQAAE